MRRRRALAPGRRAVRAVRAVRWFGRGNDSLRRRSGCLQTRVHHARRGKHCPGNGRPGTSRRCTPRRGKEDKERHSRRLPKAKVQHSRRHREMRCRLCRNIHRRRSRRCRAGASCRWKERPGGAPGGTECIRHRHAPAACQKNTRTTRRGGAAAVRHELGKVDRDAACRGWECETN